MAFKIIPLPAGELWGCLLCEMLLGRNTNATVLLLEGEPGKRGVVRTGLCGNHVEVFSVEDLRRAEARFRGQCSDVISS